MPNPQLLARILLAFSLVVLAVSPADAQYPFTVIAKTGDQAAGLPDGVQYRIFFAPQVTTGGVVGVSGFLQGTGVNTSNDHAVWVGAPGALSVIARKGQVAPGVPGNPVFDQTFTNFQVNDSAQAVFSGHLSSLSFPNNQGIWSTSTGTLAQVARASAAIPGQPGLTYGQILQGPIFNNAGQIGFATNVVGQTGGTFWLGNANGVVPVARAGTQVPGMPAGANWDFFQVDNLNDNGAVGFWGRSTNTGGVSDATNEGVWAGTPGNLALAVREGFQAPGMPIGATFFSFSAPGFNDQGQVMLRGSVQGGGTGPGNNTGMWIGTPGNVTLLAREGQQASGLQAGVNYGSFTVSPTVSFRLANNGVVAIDGLVSGAGVNADNAEVIWVGTTGGLTPVAREGDFLPGSTTVKFGAATGGVFNTNGTMSLSENGWVAFQANLIGDGVTSDNNISLWVVGPGGLHLIARTGDVIDLDPGEGQDLRTIDQLSLGPDGLRGNYLAWGAEFTDGTDAIFLSPVPVPEPGCVLLVSAVVTGLGVVGRRWRPRARG
jgi:hypothetical protein